MPQCYQVLVADIQKMVYFLLMVGQILQVEHIRLQLVVAGLHITTYSLILLKEKLSNIRKEIDYGNTENNN